MKNIDKVSRIESIIKKKIIEQDFIDKCMKYKVCPNCGKDLVNHSTIVYIYTYLICEDCGPDIFNLTYTY